MDQSLRDLALAVHDAAIRGADPARAVRDALAADDAIEVDTGGRVWILAAGKAAHAMASAAVETLAARGLVPAGGLVVAPEEAAPPHASIEVVVGDHPVPNSRSRAAAERLGDVAARVAERDTALVLVSGGTTSLLAAPVDGVANADLSRLFDALLGSGADIVTMNAVRKRFARWGAGRLAAALAGRVRCLVASDVVGDDPASVASGPCAPDAHTAADVLALVEREGLDVFVPSALLRFLEETAAGVHPETPKPGDPVFDRVRCDIVLSNHHALAAAERRARELGLAPVRVMAEPLDDEAAFTGPRLVDELIRFREAGQLDDEPASSASCMLWGGETTVYLGAASTVAGGRCQELALAAAQALAEAGARGEGMVLLAAGTDGRDGPTDAAGAVVDATTWKAIESAGRDPESDLAEHRSHAALDAVGALVRTGPTGTNVQDIVVGIVRRSAPSADAIAESLSRE